MPVKKATKKKKKKSNELTIKRSEWLNGNLMVKEDEDRAATETGGQDFLPSGGTGTSCLLREDGKKCCLGFYALQVGIPKKEIFVDTDGSPSQISNSKQRKKLALLLTEDLLDDTKICRQLIEVNDATKGRYSKQIAKEKRITELFGKLGVKVKFV